MSARITGPADIRDKRWLDDRVEAVRTGVGSAIEVYTNWTEGRGVARLYPGVSAYDFLRERIPQFALGPADIPALVEQTNLSASAIAELAGVVPSTVTSRADFSILESPRVGKDGVTGRTGRPRLAPESRKTTELYTALRAVADLENSIDEVLSLSTQYQHQRLRAMALRVGRIVKRLDVDVL